MVCQTCGRPLPAGAQSCPNCGTPAPYTMPVSGTEPTVLAAPGGSGVPPTNYGQGPQNYEAPPPDPYGQPSAPNQYGTPPPPPAPYAPYGAPQPGGYGMPPQRPQKSRVGMIIGIGVGVAVLLCIIVSVAVYEAGKNTNNTVAKSTATTTPHTAPTNTPTTAPTTAPTTPSSNSPSGLPVDSTASSIITHIQSASAIDSNYKPTNVTRTFQTNKTLYVTYDLNLNDSTGYVEVKWYVDGQVGATKIFNANNPSYANGEFSITYTVATSQAAAELYWCMQANCSDEALAGYVTFTVSDSGYHIGSQAPLTFSTAIWRRD
jgi:hypothetical protein